MNLHDPKYRFLKRRISMISFRRVLKSWIRIRDIKISLSQPRLPVRPQMSVRPMTNANSDLKTRPSLSLSLSLSLSYSFSYSRKHTLSVCLTVTFFVSLSHSLQSVLTHSATVQSLSLSLSSRISPQVVFLCLQIIIEVVVWYIVDTQSAVSQKELALDQKLFESFN